jgi:leucyl/phenylalanyl-tRNA---protein transferase
MTPETFPDPLQHDFPEWATIGPYIYDARDIIAFGAPLSRANLIEAYRKGIFPWNIERMPLPWFCPERRAIIEFDRLHIPASLKRARNRREYSFSIDRDLSGVIRQCSLAFRPGQRGTWIDDDFIFAYTDLHTAGHAHSVEAWDAAGNLVGGIYGVDAGGVFCGESMFYKKPNASKLALLFLIDHLASRGSAWLDIQVMTPHMKALRAIEIDRREFLTKLKTAQALGLELF